MIRTQKYTPEVYYEQSRDFQFIGRLYDVVLNSVKTNVDIIQNSLPFNTRSSRDLLKLMSYTLGFKPKHKYSHARYFQSFYEIKVMFNQYIYLVKLFLKRKELLVILPV